jgi:hypothetical protein
MTKPTFKDSVAAYNARRLLDLKMSNGKLLRDFTPDNCYAHGGWLTAVGWWIDDHTGQRKIGDVFGEKMLGLYFMVFHGPWQVWFAKADPSENVQPGDEFDGTRLEPEEPHFGRHANHFARYAEQIGRATSKAAGRIRRRRKSRRK